jgi:hypothetical protein
MAGELEIMNFTDPTNQFSICFIIVAHTQRFYELQLMLHF